MKRFIVKIILILLPALMAAQDVEIKGSVYDVKSGQKLSGVRVSVPRLGLVAFSDTAGAFFLKGPLGTQAELFFDLQGYETFNQVVTLFIGIPNDYIIYMKAKDAVKLPVFEVIDSAIYAATYKATILKLDEIEQTYVRDVGELLRTVPNVSGIRRGGAHIDPVIRGFKYSQLNVVLNGAQAVEGGCPNRMDPATSRADADDIERIEVYKGPYALRYGASLGGTVNIVMKQPEPFDTAGVKIKGTRGYEAQMNGHKEHISISGGNKNAFAMLSGGRMNYGNYIDGNGNYVKSAFSKFNYSAKIGGDYKNKYHFLFGITQSHHAVLFPALPMDESDDNSTLTYAEYRYIPQRDVLKSVIAKAYISDVHHIMDNKLRPVSDTVVAISDVVALTTGAKLESMLSLFKGGLLLGLDYQKREKDGERIKNMVMQPTLPIKTENLWNEAQIENSAFYAEYSRKAGSIDFVLSARYDYNRAWSDTIKLIGTPGQTLLNNTDTRSAYHNVSYSGGLKKSFENGFGLGFSAGRVSRSPDMLERFIILLPVGYDFYDYLGNPSLKPEINNQADIVFNYAHKLVGVFEVNLFTAYVQDFIYGKIVPPSEQLPLTQFVKGVKRFENGPDVSISGFELAWNTPEQSRIKARLTAAYSYGIVTESVKHIVTQTENYQVTIANDALNEIPPFETNLDVMYPLFKGKLTPGVSLRYVTSQNHVSEAFAEEPTPAFMLLNCNLNYTFNKYLSLYAGVKNVFDTPYYEHLNRRVANTIGKLFEPGRVVYGSLVVKF